MERVLDMDSPFLELMPLAGYGQDEMTVGGMFSYKMVGSIVAGIGLGNSKLYNSPRGSLYGFCKCSNSFWGCCK